MKKIILGGFLALALSLTVALPAKAFYLEVPSYFKDLFPKTSAQEGATMAPKPIMESPQLGQPSISPALEPITDGTAILPNTGINPSATCLVNGKELPGTCDQYNKQPQQDGNNQPPTVNGQGQGDNRGPDNERMLKDVKRGVTDVERQLKQFKMMVSKFEKQGTVISEDLKSKITTLKTLIAKYKTITSAEELQEMNMDELWQGMRDLEEERQNLERTANVLREMRRIETGVKMFEKQIAKLVKQKVTMPADITANLEKVKTIIAAIKSGQTENAEDIFEAMQELDQSRGQLEMLARWPQTVKEMDQELKNLVRETKRAKTIADRLSKKGMDLSGTYAELEAAVNKMKETRDATVAKMQAGESEEAFEMVQNDFFGQMEDTWQGHKIIMTMNNFGQFNADFTRGIAQAQREIKAVERKKIDATALKDLLTQAKAKGAEVKEMFKAKPLDPDSIMAVLEELEDLRQEFDQMLAELTGAEEEMPWEKGPRQFQSMQASPTLQKLIPRKSESVQQQPAAQNYAPGTGPTTMGL